MTLVPIRCFVVGFPRSGTTLLQAILASHPDAFSFPESHFFKKIRGRLAGMDVPFVSPRVARAQLRALAEELQAETWLHSHAIWRLGISPQAFGRAFREIVDAACTRRGKALWVEKSPIHLHYIEDIARVVPNHRFIHIVRDGQAAVASFYARCLADPGWIRQVLPGDPMLHLREEERRPHILDKVIARWNHDVRITMGYLESPAHSLVLLHRLVEDPPRELTRLCDFLGIQFDAAMLDQRQAARDVIGPRIVHPYMRGALGPIGREAKIPLAKSLAPALADRIRTHLFCEGRVERIFDGFVPPERERGMV